MNFYRMFDLFTQVMEKSVTTFLTIRACLGVAFLKGSVISVLDCVNNPKGALAYKYFSDVHRKEKPECYKSNS